MGDSRTRWRFREIISKRVIHGKKIVVSHRMWHNFEKLNLKEMVFL